MKAKVPSGVKDGVGCRVVGGTHEGKEGIVRDVNTSKTGHVTITVVQADGSDSRRWRRMWLCGNRGSGSCGGGRMPGVRRGGVLGEGNASRGGVAIGFIKES